MFLAETDRLGSGLTVSLLEAFTCLVTILPSFYFIVLSVVLGTVGFPLVFFSSPAFFLSSFVISDTVRFLATLAGGVGFGSAFACAFPAGFVFAAGFIFSLDLAATVGLAADFALF